MKKLFIVMLSFVFAQLASFAQPTITSPAPNATYYEGETVEIRWKSTRPDPWSTVNLALKTEDLSREKWIKVAAPNNGSYTWKAERLGGFTRLLIEVADGGFHQHRTTVPIVVLEGSRPKPVITPVSLALKPIEILQWVSRAGNDHRVERQSEGGNWEKIVEETIDFTDSYLVVEAATTTTRYRVTDTTANTELELITRPGMSVEWPSIPGRTYRLERSNNLRTWETTAEGTVDWDRCAVAEFADEGRGFYRVVDITPL